MKITYLLAGAYPVHPLSKSNINIELNYNQEAVIEQNQPHVGIRNLYFGREDVQLFRNIINDGIAGTGPGIFEGVYFDIQFEHNGITNVLRSYIDLTDGFEFSKDGCQVSVRLYESLDWFNSKIDGFTFESLFNESAYWQNRLRSKFIFVPYVICVIPNYQEAMTSLITAVMLGNELIRTIKQLVKDIVNICHWIDFVHLAAAIAMFCMHLVYAVALIASLISFITDFILYIIQPVKYQCSMLIKDMLEIACEKLGLEFESSIYKADDGYMNDWAIIPEHFGYPDVADQNISSIANLWSPLYAMQGSIGSGGTVGNLSQAGHDVANAMGFSITDVNAQGINNVISFLSNPAFILSIDALNSNMIVDINSKLKGYICPNAAQRGYINGTGGDAFRYAKKLCNGKIIIKNGVAYLERRDFTFSSSTRYRLPDVRNDWNGYNTKEFNAVMMLKFASDKNDKNVFDNYSGTIFESTQLPLHVNDNLLVLTKNIREIDFGLARGINKTSLTVPEQLLPLFVQQINTFIAQLTVIYDINAVIIDVTVFVTDMGINGLIMVLDTVVLAIRGLILVINSIIFGLATTVATIAIALDTILIPLNLIVGVLNGSPFNAGIGVPAIIDPVDVFSGLMANMIDPNSIPFLNIIDPTYAQVPVLSIPSDISVVEADRTNMLLLENDYIDIPKVVKLGTPYSVECNPTANVALLHANNLTNVHAQSIFERYYSIDLWVKNINGVANPSGTHNQYVLISPALNKPGDKNKIQFGFEDFDKVKNENTIDDSDGQECKIDNLTWYIEDGYVEMNIRRNEIYTNNLQLINSLPDGN